MRILYFNYQNSSFASILRSLEYAKAASEEGHDVALCYLHPAFNPPSWYYDVIAAYESPRLVVHFPTRKPVPPNPIPSTTSQVLNKSKKSEWKPRTRHIYMFLIRTTFLIPKELQWVLRFKPDILLARADPNLSTVVTAKLRSLPLVFEADGLIEEFEQYWGLQLNWLKKIDAWRMRQADAILYISQFCKEYWMKKNIPEEKLFYTPNAAHPDKFKPLVQEIRHSMRQKLGLEGFKVIGFSGILRPWQGVDNLLDAALPLFNKDPKIKILFIGSSYDEDVLNRCNVPEDIRKNQMVFTGRVPYSEMSHFIDLADCLVLPYPQKEFFYFSPMKLFEGMSLAKVIVAPKLGQIEEMLAGLSSPVLYEPTEGVNALRESLEIGLARGCATKEGKPAGEDVRMRIQSEHTWAHRGKVVIEACQFALSNRKKT